MRAHVVVTVLAIVAAPAVAIADEPVVLAVDGTAIYVGVGGMDGVAAGAELELLHAVVARDPTTGARLRDEFAIGALVVERAGDHVAIAHAEAAVAGRIAPGDHVRLIGAPEALRDPWLARVAAASSPTAVTVPSASGTGTVVAPVPPPSTAVAVADTEAVHATWRATLGTQLADRIQRWRTFLADHRD